MTTIIDFEASGLDLKQSYPIEVGLATVSDTDEITVWSALIKRQQGWSHWSPESERVHNISRFTLAEQGLDAQDVAVILNSALVGETVYCDGHRYDQFWMDRLYEAAAIEPTWKLGDFNLVLFGSGLAPLETVSDIIDRLHRLKTPHRAGEDARILAEFYRDTRDVIRKPPKDD